MNSEQQCSPLRKYLKMNLQGLTIVGELWSLGQSYTYSIKHRIRHYGNNLDKSDFVANARLNEIRIA